MPWHGTLENDFTNKPVFYVEPGETGNPTSFHWPLIEESSGGTTCNKMTVWQLQRVRCPQLHVPILHCGSDQEGPRDGRDKDWMGTNRRDSAARSDEPAGAFDCLSREPSGKESPIAVLEPQRGRRARGASACPSNSGRVRAG